MIAVDTNLLVHAHRADSAHHARAVERLRSLRDRAWAIPWPCAHEFVAIVTHSRIFDPPSPLDDALGAVDDWMRSPMLTMLGESPEHWGLLAKLARAARITGPRIHDARIAALCLGHGVRELWTADRDFSRFPQLKTLNPLLEA